MALVLKDRVLETCTSPGTGTITLLGAVTGYQAFSTVGNGNTCYYAIADQNGANWEVGIGTYSSGTLARTTVLSSSNAGSLTNFSTGSQNVFLTYPSERSVNLSSAALTSGRVAYATTDGLLTDSVNLVFNGTQLGIATNSPIYTLDVNGDVKVTNTLRYYVGATQYGLSFANAGAVGTEAYQGTYIYWGTGSGASATEKMRITNAGNVGIGTTSPINPLQVNGAITVSGAYATLPATSVLTLDYSGGLARYFSLGANTSTAGGHAWYGYSSNTGVGDERMRLDSSGNLIVAPTASNTALAKFTVRGYKTITTFGNVSASFSDDASSTFYVSHPSGTILLSSDTALAFGAGSGAASVERMRITDTGNVGIGTSSPSYLLDVNGTSRIRTGLILNPNTSSLYATDSTLSSYATNNGVYLNGFAGGNLELQADGTQATAVILTGNSSTVPNIITFKTASTERMRIDSAGNVGLGVTPSAWGSPFSNVLQFTKGAIACQSNSIQLMNNSYYNGTDYKYVATAGAGMYEQTGGLHVWTGAASGSAGATISFSERMRIDASGRLLVGTTSTTCGGNTISAGGVNIEASANFATGITTPAGNQFAMLFANGSNGIVGSISLTTTLTAYNVTSDQRLKTNVVDAPSGNINDIKVRSFDWIADGSHQEYGMVAQELIEVAPYAVTKPVNPDDMMQVDYSKLVPMMIREIQDLKQRIKTLENK